MKNIKKILVTLLGLTLLNSCGYKIKNTSLKNNFNITDISSTGQTRINYDIKNKLFLSNNSQSQNLLTLNLVTQKNKTIKNKNENNEISDYQLTIQSDVTLNFMNQIKNETFTVSETGSYKVSKYRINTLNNEKKLIVLMSENIAKKILTKINNFINDN